MKGNVSLWWAASHLCHTILDRVENVFLTYLWLYWVFLAAQAFLLLQLQGLLFVVLHGLLIVVASLVAEHRF